MQYLKNDSKAKLLINIFFTFFLIVICSLFYSNALLVPYIYFILMLIMIMVFPLISSKRIKVIFTISLFILPTLLLIPSKDIIYSIVFYLKHYNDSSIIDQVLTSYTYQKIICLFVSIFNVIPIIIGFVNVNKMNVKVTKVFLYIMMILLIIYTAFLICINLYIVYLNGGFLFDAFTYCVISVLEAIIIIHFIYSFMHIKKVLQ